MNKTYIKKCLKYWKYHCKKFRIIPDKKAIINFLPPKFDQLKLMFGRLI